MSVQGELTEDNLRLITGIFESSLENRILILSSRIETRIETIIDAVVDRRFPIRNSRLRQLQ